ncbi:MAG TPA: multiubiquitin domain-containing protein [Cyclobacteriaceae bacterium]|nr:multiubiquitin domain-containing protein [Cyclobacteriaceae bacterium]HMX00892.1 multiubiquitin domain-containing protein [Cyclobacteriaceae bacterium]HMY93696.1 multiubiquitin domain-containing protein [Cyclobacteriaceae bacterium]HNK25140.1 multiubiquitin domain-containing protein [Cyclobacteriaceae bacterium]HNK82839.1 multiubiquitin domain-containing protein [Cyclobacteriaceae bacterium]
MESEIIDVEQFSKEGKTPPKANKYRIKIDREVYVVEKGCMTGRELLALAGKNPPERFQLNMKLKGGKVEPIGLDETVCFTKPGIEKFMTLPLDQTEGEERKQFHLLEEDAEYLDSLGLPWETLSDSTGMWIIVYNYPVCSGYNVETVTVAIKVEPGYPRAQLDMAYFYPALSRKDGQPIGAVSGQQIDGKAFQRWSRHRTGENPWREGIDNLGTHLSLVSFWFKQEFDKRANAVPA